MGVLYARVDGAWVPLTLGVQGPPAPTPPSYFARYYRTAAFTFPATANTIAQVIFDTVVGTDYSGGAYNPSTGLYTCPVAGLYSVIAQVSYGTSGTNVLASTIIRRNGVNDAQANQFWPTTNAQIVRAHEELFCNAGDTLACWGQTSQASAIMRTAQAESFFSVRYLGPGT